ncbi:tRNA pseudouridine(38-40) synthase TruA [Veillonella intestinalis]|uniref:tRNA pseudouridine(38-40) synthase TruA n=1 Tax=Veillonella intestinalis TaxID=2941341 RepID=UPI00203AEF25|nr:tRNA pseudouridine(38-40) synthase TruA [Veillonella intestinalis]
MEIVQRNIRLIVAYDGTELNGYQSQQNGITVQDCLEKALSRVCNEPISIYGASRTDAGVHACFQVVTFFTSGRIPVENLTRALIAHLPPYIVIRRAEEIPLDWKPRWNIVGKEYVYTIYNDIVADPLNMRYHWHVKKPLNHEAILLAARYLEGTHDFTTLQGANSTPANPVKTIYAVVPLFAGDTLRLHVIGDGFLYHMVRNIAGLIVDVGLGRIQPEAIPDLLAQRDRRCIGKTAPAQGLCLEEIFFDEIRRTEVLKSLGR